MALAKIARRAKSCAFCQICGGHPPQPKPGMKLCKLWPNGCKVLKGIFEFKRINKPSGATVQAAASPAPAPAPAGAKDG